MNPKRKRGYVYYSIIAIGLALVYFIQSSTPALPTIFGVKPMPAFIFMLCISAFGGETVGIISGLALGIATDIGSTSPDGFNALVMMIMGLACSLLATYLFNDRLPAAAVLCGIFTALYYILNWVVIIAIKGFEGTWLYLAKYSLPAALYTWIFVFLFWPLVKFFSKVGPKAKTNNSLLE